MTALFSYSSAQEHWHLNPTSIHHCEKVLYAKKLISIPPAVNFEELQCAQEISRPLHLLVAHKSLRRPSKRVICHIWGSPLPKGSVLDTGKGYYVCSPELCFLQMASCLTLPKLIEFGFELCGTYNTSQKGIRKVQALTTVKKLLSFVSKMRSVDHSSKALSALRFVANNSASPRETIVTMLLCLPYKMGGYGINKPTLNQRIDLDTKISPLTIASFYSCDLYWPEAKLAVEYDSDLFHVGAERITHDSTKRSDLAILGIETLSVTNRQVKDRREFDKFARLLAQRTGKRIRYTEPNFSQTCLELRKTLFSSL